MDADAVRHRPGLLSFVVDALTVVALSIGLTGLYASRLEKTGALQRALDFGDRVSVFVTARSFRVSAICSTDSSPSIITPIPT